MEQRYLIDTNVLIDAQMGRFSRTATDFLAEVIDESFVISFVTFIEYLGYKDISFASEEFISLAEVIEIDRQIIRFCIILRRNYKIKLPDAIIAATALARGLILITNNEKDFVSIQNLKVINLHRL